MGRAPCYKLKTSTKSWAHLTKTTILATFYFWQLCKKGQLVKCITLSILTLEMFSWTFRKLRMSSKQPFWYHLNWVFHVHVWSFDPKGVFVDFPKWPIMSKFIFFVSAYSELGSWRLIVCNCILFKMRFGWVISDKI